MAFRQKRALHESRREAPNVRKIRYFSAAAEESLKKQKGTFRAEKHSKRLHFRLRDSRKTRVLQCFGRRKPAPECSSVARRHVFYGIYEAILDYRDDLRKPLYLTMKLGLL